jgi:tetratricopeptide (TPR) repeat protein
MISEFVKVLVKLEKRDVLQLLRQSNSAVMLNHSLMADSLSVLANCTALNESDGVELLDVYKSRFCWSLAYQHYRRAFEGWSKVGQRLHHPNISAIICSLARCLRETGERKKAIKILEAVVSAAKNEAMKNNKREGFQDTIHILSNTVEFFPLKTKATRLSRLAWSNTYDEQINALCLWSLAVYRIEENPNERERIHALNLLHTSAECLHKALKYSDCKDRSACLEMLRCIEAEAQELFEPIKSANDEGDVNGLDEGFEHKDPVNNLKKRLETAARQIQGRFVSA